MSNGDRASVWGREKVLEMTVVMATHNVDALNATRLCTYKWMRRQILCYVYLAIKLKNRESSLPSESLGTAVPSWGTCQLSLAAPSLPGDRSCPEVTA